MRYLLLILLLVGLFFSSPPADAIHASTIPSQSSLSPTWTSVVQEYRAGDADRAVREVLSWPKERLEKQAATEADCTRLIAQKNVETLRAAIALHAEAAVTSPSLDGFRLQDHVPLVLFTTVVEKLWATLEIEERTSLRGLYIDWIVLGSSYLSTVGQPLLAERRLEDARTKLARLQALSLPAPAAPVQSAASTDDADILLALGSAREMALMMLGVPPAMTAKAPRSPDSAFVTRRTGRSDELESVADLYRQALDLQPSLVEARVRLGRALCLAGNPREATVELERARRDAGRGYLFYLASLFLGDAYEQVGEHGRAADCYRSAIAEYPEAQAAYLALASLPDGGGQEDTPAKMLAQMFGTEAAKRPERDPWWMYPYGQAWQFQARIDVLRRMARK